MNVRPMVVFCRYNKVKDYSADDTDLPTPHFTVSRIPKGQWKLGEEDITEKRIEASTRVEARFGGGSIWCVLLQWERERARQSRRGDLSRGISCLTIFVHRRRRCCCCRYPGTICTSNEDGTYKILYDDGDIEHQVAREFVRTI